MAQLDHRHWLQRVWVPSTWGKLHFTYPDASKIAVSIDCKLSLPSISVMTLNICVTTNKAGKEEVVVILCLINKSYQMDKPALNSPFREHFCILGQSATVTFPFDFRSPLDFTIDAQQRRVTKTKRHLGQHLVHSSYRPTRSGVQQKQRPPTYQSFEL